jgi:5-hydroxyisourate hydrolase-like protein (transthyretin family)
MRSMVKWFAPVVALGLLVGYSASQAVAADDAKGSVSGTVTGQDGKPAANVAVRLMAAPAKHEKKADAGASGEKPKHPAPVAEGQTDENGKFKLDGVDAGSYVVAAGSKGAGMGREKVTVTAGSDTEVSITLKAAGEKGAAKGEGHKKHKKKGGDENN